jgi:LysR family transcriptional activator of nhaA
MTFKYADEIFALGNELLNRVEGAAHSKVSTLHIGIADVVPKFLAYRLIEPALRGKPKPHIIIHEDKSERLISELGTKELDLVISDSPIPHHSKVRAYNHFLGECGIAFMATEKLAKQYQRDFPASLDGAPLMLPSEVAAVRRELDHWFEQEEIEPEIVAEFQDSALMKTFARRGHGILPLPIAVEREVTHEYGLRVVGRVEKVKERFYLISVERRVKHPAVLTICEQAHERLFG